MLSLSTSAFKSPQSFPWTDHTLGENTWSTHTKAAFELTLYRMPMQVYSSPSLEKKWEK